MVCWVHILSQFVFACKSWVVFHVSKEYCSCSIVLQLLSPYCFVSPTKRKNYSNSFIPLGPLGRSCCGPWPATWWLLSRRLFRPVPMVQLQWKVRQSQTTWMGGIGWGKLSSVTVSRVFLCAEIRGVKQLGAFHPKGPPPFSLWQLDIFVISLVFQTPPVIPCEDRCERTP